MTKLQAPTVAHWPRAHESGARTSVSSCCRSSSVGPSLRWPNDNLQALFSSTRSSTYSAGAATPPPRSSRPTPAVVPRRSGPAKPVVSSPLRSCPPFDYVIPRAPPGPQSSNYIHSALRLSGSRGSNSVHLSLRTGCDSNDRTSCVFLFPPLSRPSPTPSTRLCLAR